MRRATSSSPRTIESAASAVVWNSSITFSVSGTGTWPSETISDASDSISGSLRCLNTSAVAWSPIASSTTAALRAPVIAVVHDSLPLTLPSPPSSCEAASPLFRFLLRHRRHAAREHREPAAVAGLAGSAHPSRASISLSSSATVRGRSSRRQGRAGGDERRSARRAGRCSSRASSSAARRRAGRRRRGPAPRPCGRCPESCGRSASRSRAAAVRSSGGSSNATFSTVT